MTENLLLLSVMYKISASHIFASIYLIFYSSHASGCEVKGLSFEGLGKFRFTKSKFSKSKIDALGLKEKKLIIISLLQ